MIHSGSKYGFTETEALINRAKGGDREALGMLWTRYGSTFKRLVRASLGKPLRSKVDSGDILNSTFREVMMAIETFECRTEGAFLHWVSKLMANKIRDKARYFSRMGKG